MLAVNQKGAHGGAFAEGGDSIIWSANAVGSDAKYIAVFNVGDQKPIEIRIDWPALQMAKKCVLRDLWEHKDLGAIDGGYTFTVPPHASGLYKLTPVK